MSPCPLLETEIDCRLARQNPILVYLLMLVVFHDFHRRYVLSPYTVYRNSITGLYHVNALYIIADPFPVIGYIT